MDELIEIAEKVHLESPNRIIENFNQNLKKNKSNSSLGSNKNGST